MSRGGTVVIGVGNPYRSDDGVGPAVAERLRQRLPEDVLVVEHDGEPVGLLDLWDGAGMAVVVDAVATRDGKPGDVHRVELDGSTTVGATAAVSSHGPGPGEAVELARVLDRMPGRLVLYGVEGANFSAGVTLSPEVGASIPGVVDAIAEEVQRRNVP